MRSSAVLRLALCGMLAALVLVLTMFVRVPIPGSTDGYVHIGDSAIYSAAFVLGPLGAAATAAVGSMLADLLVGATVYALPTFIIKGMMAIIAAWGFKKFKKNLSGQIPAMMLAGAFMVIGYFLADLFMFGIAAALGSLPFNAVQMVVGIVIAIPVLKILEGRSFLHKKEGD